MDNVYNQPRRKKTSRWKIFFGILFGLSVLGNILMLFLVLMMGIAIAMGGAGGTYLHEVIETGPSSKKIAVIRIEGIINKEVEEIFKSQLNTAWADRTVKAVVVSVDSPGGGVTSSDNIYHAIQRYKDATNNPVVCYMDGLAASGGYYSAVSCDKIVASPTTITGSIGVIMGHLDIKQLLEEKLGVVPTTIKSGQKKDWPSMFRQITEEEKSYLFEKVIDPAYKRFVKLVDQGRENLTEEQVLALADGSIYFANEALEKGLVDEIGYADTAYELAKVLAGLDDAQVFEYKKPFSLSDMLGVQSKSLTNLDKTTLLEMTIPKVMYLWTGSN